jgi:hypothetical protein
MMMTFITQGGEGQGDTSKESEATKSKGRGLEEGASRALMARSGRKDVVGEVKGVDLMGVLVASSWLHQLISNLIQSNPIQSHLIQSNLI